MFLSLLDSQNKALLFDPPRTPAAHLTIEFFYSAGSVASGACFT